MNTQKKNIANHNTSARSTGPKDRTGKRCSAPSRITHDIFADELVLTEREKPEFEELRAALHPQYAPASPMQEIAFDRVLYSCWCSKRATRPREVADSTASANRSPSRWYGAGNAELQVARRFFDHLRNDIAANGFRHHEDWRDPLIKACGSQEFYNSLMELEPDASVDDILLFRAISAKREMYKMLVPRDLRPGSGTARVIMASRLKWEMALRLVDERRQHLEDLVRTNSLRGAGSGEGNEGDPVDAVTRNFAVATRELERSVKWYLELKEQGL